MDRSPKATITYQEVADEERQHIDQVGLFYDLIALALHTDSTDVTLETGLGFQTAELNLDSYHQISHHGKSEGRSNNYKSSTLS